jgi:Cysteine rich repeat
MNRCIIRAAKCGALIVVFTAAAQAQQPTDAQISAVRSACRGDYKSVCAGVPTGGKEALQCLQQHADAVSPACHVALAPLSGKADAPTAAQAAPAQAASSAAAAISAAPPMTARQQAHLLRTDCSADFEKFCSTVQLGGGRGVACLKAHAAELTQLCQSALLAVKKP